MMFVQSRAYHVPLTVVVSVSVTLVAALVLNAISTYVSIASSFEEITLNGAQTALPLDVRPAALTVAPVDHYGAFDDSDWESIIPPGHGFVRVAEEYYAVSIYHQIHCVNSFRKMFVGSMHANGSIGMDMLPHIEHCLSYLRQMVLCHGDTTLEPSHPALSTSGGSTQAVYGEGVTHRCQDWSQIRSYVEENYFSWKDEDTLVVTEGGRHDHHNSHTHQHQPDSSGGGHAGHHHEGTG